jgi:xanthine dehydrogenase/oxidase
VFFAIRHAIAAARKDNGLEGPWTLYSPATPERIRLAIGDDLLSIAEEGCKGEKGFFVSIY